MSAKRSKRKPAKAVHGEPIPAGSTGRKHPLRVPQLKDGEGIADLLPDEEALIQLEITQRTARQWSQDDVANQVGVSRSEIQHLEHRRRGMSLRVAILICRAFGMRLVLMPK